MSRLRHARAAGVPSRLVSSTAPILVLPLVAFTVSISSPTGSNAQVDCRLGDVAALAEPTVAASPTTSGSEPDSIRPLPTTERTQEIADTGLGTASPSTRSRTLCTRAEPGVDFGNTVVRRTECRIGIYIGPAGARRSPRGPSGEFLTERTRSSVGIRPRATTTTKEVSMLQAHPQPDLRRPPRRATVVRVALENDAAPAAAIAVTEPFKSSLEPLTQALAAGGRRRSRFHTL